MNIIKNLHYANYAKLCVYQIILILKLILKQQSFNAE